MDYIENRTFDEIQLGDSASLTRTLTMEDIQLFAVMSGDIRSHPCGRGICQERYVP